MTEPCRFGLRSRVVCPLAGFSGGLTLPRARGCPPRVGPRSLVQADNALSMVTTGTPAKHRQNGVPFHLCSQANPHGVRQDDLVGYRLLTPVKRFRSSLCHLRPTCGNPRKGSLHWDNPQYRCAGECFENTAFDVPALLLLCGLAVISRPITSLDRCIMTSFGVTSNADVIDLL